jgi:hypothetical protein
VAGGGVAVGAVGVEAGSKYQIMSNARTTAAAMMSNLFVSMGLPSSLCRTTLAPLEALGQVKRSGRRGITAERPIRLLAEGRSARGADTRGRKREEASGGRISTREDGRGSTTDLTKLQLSAANRTRSDVLATSA